MLAFGDLSSVIGGPVVSERTFLSMVIFAFLLFTFYFFLLLSFIGLGIGQYPLGGVSVFLFPLGFLSFLFKAVACQTAEARVMGSGGGKEPSKRLHQGASITAFGLVNR